MIWLRLFIAVIALTISSDLSAWGQTMQVNSPEGFYDCKGIANGANVRDREGGCCLPSEKTEAPCFLCNYPHNFCEKQTGVCRTTTTADMNKRCCDAHPFPCNDCYRPSMTFCETQLNQCGATPNVGCGCGNPAPNACDSCTGDRSCYGCDGVAKSGKTVVCDTCGGTMGGCGRCGGCLSCSFNWGCQDAGTGCNPSYSDPSQACPGSGSIGHGATITRINHGSIVRRTGYLWSTNPYDPPEELSCFTQSFQTYTCNDGTLQFLRDGKHL